MFRFRRQCVMAITWQAFKSQILTTKSTLESRIHKLLDDTNREYLGRVALKLLRWYAFGILISVTPFVLNGYHLRVSDQKPDLAHILERGDLLLVSAAIAASAMGELLGTGKNYIFLKI